MLNKKRLAIFMALIFIVGVILITTKVKQRSDGIKFVIGMSQANLTEPWRISMDREVINEAKNYKNLKVIYKDGGGDTEKQKSDINELLNSGVDLLIVSTNDSKKLEAVISKVHKQIPVIVLDRAIEGHDYTLYIGPDNKRIGKKAGEFAAELVGYKKSNVIEVQGVLDSVPSLEMSQGFREVIKKRPNIKIEDTVIGEWQRDEVEDDMKNLLKDNKDVDVIFAQNDYMALGAYKAAQSNGLSNVKIIGVDALSGKGGGLDLVKKGILAGTFTCSTGGREAVDYAMDILTGKGNVPKTVILKSERITRSNVYKYLSDR